MTNTDKDQARPQRNADIQQLRALWDEGIGSGSAGELDIDALLRRANAASHDD